MAVRLAIETRVGVRWAWSSGRGKILRQQDNRIHMTDSKYLNIIKAVGGGELVPEVKFMKTSIFHPPIELKVRLCLFPLCCRAYTLSAAGGKWLFLAFHAFKDQDKEDDKEKNKEKDK